jgi:hypothetical protein
MTRVSGAHHVLSIELLLGEFWNGKSTVLLGSTGSKRSESDHEKVKTRERDQVHSHLAKVRVELTRETKAGSAAGHSSGYKVVQVTICRGGELKGTEADIVQSFVVKYHDFISVLNKLVNGEGGVVWLNNGIGHLRGWENREGKHDAVWVFLTDLGDQ